MSDRVGEVLRELDDRLIAEMNEHTLPGLGVGVVRGSEMKRGRLRPVKYLEIVVGPAGSMFSSARDMARHLVALLNGGAHGSGRVLRPETLATMLRPQYELDPRLPAMGLGFLLDRFDGHRVAGHHGGWPGFVSSMLFAPDDGVGVIALTNTASPAIGGIAAQLLRSLLGLADPAEELPRPGVLESPLLWPELTGFYGPAPGLLTNLRVWAGMGGEVEVFVKDGHLALRALSPLKAIREGLRLYPVDPEDPLLFHTTFEGAVMPVLFRRNAAGEVDELLGAPTLTRLHKRPLTRSVRFRTLVAAGGILGAGAAAVTWRRQRSG